MMFCAMFYEPFVDLTVAGRDLKKSSKAKQNDTHSSPLCTIDDFRHWVDTRKRWRRSYKMYNLEVLSDYSIRSILVEFLVLSALHCLTGQCVCMYYLCTGMYVCMYVCMYVRMHVCMHERMHVFVFAASL
jgi:hypothetical protein